jgi:hypothetical protein
MSSNAIFNILRCKEILEKRFPNATVTYEHGALQVEYSDGYFKYVDSYKAIDGKLTMFNSQEIRKKTRS